MFAQAEGYERFMGRWSRMLAERFVTFLKPVKTWRVLDVGSGTGSLARAILATSPGIEVVGIDPSPAFVEYASGQVNGRAHFQIGDAQRMPFADGAFDACCAQLVLNFIPNRRAALAEMKRVAKPGGTLAAAVWDHAAGMNMLRIFWEVADRVDPNPQTFHEPNRLLDRDGLAELWVDAGLGNIESAPLTFDMHFASFADYWEPFQLGQGPAGAYVRSLTPNVLGRIEAELRRRLLEKLPDGPFTLSCRAWAVRGTA